MEIILFLLWLTVALFLLAADPPWLRATWDAIVVFIDATLTLIMRIISWPFRRLVR